MDRYGIYARYSTGMQNPKSTKDQIRDCRKYVQKHGGQVFREYKDDAKTGSGSIHRKDYQEMLEDLMDGKIDVILCESLDRLSRDQEDTARIYKLAIYVESQIVTLAEGEINEMHVGIKSTMNALYLKEVAKKVKRGLEGVVTDKRSPSKPPYGYEVDKDIRDAEGERLRGYIKKHEEQAAIVHRIFEEFSAGKSPLQIAKELNKEGIPSPAGKKWSDTSVRGNRSRDSGIINNTLYAGIRIWNKSRSIKNPITERREKRMNPESEWIIEEVPELAIISENLWKSAQARLKEIRESAQSICVRNKLTGARRTKYLLSSLVVCENCGKNYIIVSRNCYGCASYKYGHGCANYKRINRHVIENTILSALTEVLLEPKMVEWFLDGYKEQYREIKKRLERDHAVKVSRLQEVKKKETAILDAIERGIVTSATRERLLELEEEKKTLQDSIAMDDLDMPEPDKNLIKQYRQKVLHLSENIYDKEISIEAMNAIRPMIDRVILTPDCDDLRARIEGDITKLSSFTDKHGWHFFVP